MTPKGMLSTHNFTKTRQFSFSTHHVLTESDRQRHRRISSRKDAHFTKYKRR
jgi:hypothetical protein